MQLCRIYSIIMTVDCASVCAVVQYLLYNYDCKLCISTCSVYSIIMTVNCSCISSSHCLLSFSCHCRVLTAQLEMRRLTSVYYYYCYYVLKNIFCTVTEPIISEFTLKVVLTYTLAECCSLITGVLLIDNWTLAHKKLECSH